MANCSMVDGSMTLDGVWTDEMLMCMNIVKNQWAMWIYSIRVDEDFSKGCLSQIFNGCGRWEFNNNLRELDSWTKNEFGSNPGLEVAYKKLTTEMQMRSCYIDFIYSDEEHGASFFRDGTARFQAVDNVLIGSISEQDYDYGWKDYIEQGFDDDNMFAELIDSIFDFFQINEYWRTRLREVTEKWALENTCPNTYFDNLEVEKHRELIALYDATVSMV